MGFPFPMGPGGPMPGPAPAGPPPAGPPPAPLGGGGDGPDSQKVISAVKAAIAALDVAQRLENDPGDKAVLAKEIATLHKFLGDQQKLTDTAMGAGPGVRMVRKNAPGGAGY